MILGVRACIALSGITSRTRQTHRTTEPGRNTRLEPPSKETNESVRSFSTNSSGALRAAAARPSSAAEPRTANEPASLSFRPDNLTAARRTPPASSLPALHGQSSATPAYARCHQPGRQDQQAAKGGPRWSCTVHPEATSTSRRSARKCGFHPLSNTSLLEAPWPRDEAAEDRSSLRR
jgi:hypothetical protein